MKQRRQWMMIGLLVMVLIASSLAHGLTPRSAAQDSDSAPLVQGNNQFAFDLYQRISTQDGNLIVSPYSISLALALTYAGARGSTESQMADVLHFVLPQDQIPGAFSALDAAMPKDSGEDDSADEFRLSIANALWGQPDYPFLPEYLDLVNQNFGAGLQAVDFAADPDAARVVINDWVAEQTRQRILDLIKPGILTPDTRLVLTNAIYFKAAWQSQFMPEATREGPFTLLDGSSVDVPLMNQTATFGYAAGEGYQVVVLPYVGERMAMMILLPDDDQFAAFEQGLNADVVNNTLAALNWQDVNLTLPRFEYSAEFGLADALKALGMRDAFAPGVADFSGMSAQNDLFVQDVVHKAFVKLDETGTEAAAATAVIIGVTSAPMDPPIEVRVDHPFLYLIYDQQSGSILFMGRVLNPAG
jgi:serpin B